MSIVDTNKLSEWEKRPKEPLEKGVDKITREYLEFCLTNQAINIIYSNKGGNREKRTIHPKTVFKDYLTGKFYTQAYCELRNDLRVFNLKKIIIQNKGGADCLVESSEDNNLQKRAATCKFSHIEQINDDGFYVDSVEAECGNYGHKTWSYGRALESRKRCLAVMSEECPEGAMNWYAEG